MMSNETKWSIKRREMENAGKKLLDKLTSFNSLKTQESLEQIEIDMRQYTKFVSELITPESNSEAINEDDIDESLYGKIIGVFLQTFEENFPTLTDRFKIEIENLMIVKGSNFLMLHELLTSIIEFMKCSTRDESVEFMILILEKTVKSETLLSSIISACRKGKINDIQAEEYDKGFKNYVQILVSLPVKISNIVKGRISETFSLNNFSKIISYQIIRAILLLNEELNDQKIVFDVKPISLLISKFLLNLGSENFVELITIFICWSLENRNGMRTVIQDILLNIPRASIAPIAILLLENIENPKDVEKVFQPLMKDEHWRYILASKILLFSYFKNDKLIINLVNCLLCDSEQYLIQLIIKLFDIWGDRSALNHTTLEQHEFITKILLLSMKKLEGRLKPMERDSIQELLFSGTVAHLEHMQVEIRAIGMITGELIVNCLNESGAPKLKYDYDSMPKEGVNIVNKLKQFWNEKCENCQWHSSSYNTIPSECVIKELGVKSTILLEEKTYFHHENVKIMPEKNDRPPISVKKSRKDELSPPEDDADDNSLDSDDDLIPYDMSNDAESSKNHRPMYLRDLKENLINSSENTDPSIFAESLKSSEKLIISQLPNDDASFARELLSIISKLTEITYVENFNYLKFKACVTITKIYPKESAEYLCKEFHATIGSHSVKDRLFFLNVLGEAARELSKFEVDNEEEEISKSANVHKKLSSEPISLIMNLDIGKKIETLYDDDFEISKQLDNQEEMRTEEKRKIIAKRIKSNTRVFAHPSKRSPTTMNRFNDVASHFFYPLLYGIRKTDGNILNTPKHFEDQANILLINFVKTLSTIMVAAENCVIAPKMGRELLELAWNLRFHEQAVVRSCVIESIGAVIVAISRDNLTGDIFDLLLELRIWLDDVSQESISGDPHAECRAMARNVVNLIDSLFPNV